MPKRLVAIVLYVVLLPQFTACTVHKKVAVPPPPPSEAAKEQIVGVTLRNGTYIEFAATARVSHDTVYGAARGDTTLAIPFAQVQRLWVRRTDVALSALATFGLVAAVTLVFAAIVAAGSNEGGGSTGGGTQESCPFIYSWDGARYVFDAEPYGGAITQAFERDDYAVLEHLRAQDGRYRLMLTNEVNETQFTNLVQLWVVDHRPGERIVASEFGQLYTLSNPEPPLAARDQAGRDLRPWLSATDELIWEPEPDTVAGRQPRQDIVLTFPKPPGATRAKVVINAATGIWGSHMIREMLRLHGRDVPAWYAAIDGNSAAAESLYAWNLREELYTLKLLVEEPTGWEVRGLLPGGGPFIAEDRVVVLDVSRVQGSELRLRLRPPLGFWALNSFAVDYGPVEPVAVDTLVPVEARDRFGTSVLAELAAMDDRYYEMPHTGDRAYLSFVAPPPSPGAERTVLTHARGFYHLHLDETAPADTATLQRLAEVPDAAARLAAERFGEWHRVGSGGR